MFQCRLPHQRVLGVLESFEFLDLRVGEATAAGWAIIVGQVDVAVDGTGDDGGAVLAAKGVEICPSTEEGDA